MEPIIAAAPPAADLVKNTSTATFMADVVDASFDQPVVVDFWAPWCGPCRQLGPALEKAVKEARGAVKMVKVNIDENQDLAGQMRIQSIPAVYAFKDGRPVDGFVGALPESQVKQFVQRLAKAAGGPKESPIDEALAMAKEALAEGDFGTAGNLYEQILQHEPANVAALAGRVRALLAAKELPAARAALDAIPAEHAQHADVAAARSALELAEEGEKAVGAFAELEGKLAANANDHQARFDLATALYAAGEREAAVEHLLDIVRRDRKWNEEAARKQLLKLFEAFGVADPLTMDARKRLSSILFS
ncbi:MAG: thioredoxin [Alphaproteobacteria bacterium]|nr:thioredoxin [Alphaproteobacteria bacterium]